METSNKQEMRSRYLLDGKARGATLRLSQGINYAFLPNHRTFTSRAIVPSQTQTLLYKPYIHFENLNDGFGRKCRLDKEKKSLKKQELSKKTKFRTQYISAISDYASEFIVKQGGRASQVFKRLNTLYQHLSLYPKVLSIPLILIGFAAYGYNREYQYDTQALTNVEEAKQPEEKQEVLSIKQQVAAYTSKLMAEIFGSKENEKSGITYLEKMFKNKQVHDSLIYLLKGCIKDERFVQDSKKFGISWISQAIQADKVKTDLKNLMALTFTKDQRVINQSTEVLKYSVNHYETRELTKQICSNACLQPDTLAAVAKQLGDGGYSVVKSNEFRTEFSKNVTQIMSQEEVCNGLKSKVIYQPLADTFTFGLYSRLLSSPSETSTKESYNNIESQLQ